MKEKRQNRPSWRKVRSYKKKLKKKEGRPLRDPRGSHKFDTIKYKTKKWEKVNVSEKGKQGKGEDKGSERTVKAS